MFLYRNISVKIFLPLTFEVFFFFIWQRYLAPELLQGRADFKADIFSAGLIVYQV